MRIPGTKEATATNSPFSRCTLEVRERQLLEADGAGGAGIEALRLAVAVALDVVVGLGVVVGRGFT